MTLKLVVKNGEMDYAYNQRTGSYDTKKKDRVLEFDTLTEGLSEFLIEIDPELSGTQERKVRLIYTPDKKKKKGKKF